MADTEERIVMTPKKKTGNSTTLAMERKVIAQAGEKTKKTSLHVAGGEHSGIVINKEVEVGGEEIPAHLCLEFRVFLVNANSGKHAQEKRVLSYWFKQQFPAVQRPRYAQDFFKQLVSPTDFPRDYVGFIKKIMKLMQLSFPMFRKIEVELTQEKEIENIPDRPMSAEPSACPEASEEKVLDMIEASYPNPITLEVMCGNFTSDESTVRQILSELQLKKKIKAMENNLNAFTRVQGDKENITVVKQMPKVEAAKQPTIAIITGQYYEKMAVDAMMTNRQTFVRYATVGETVAYTVGDIGSHRCVVTKLPMTGHSREASIASGSSTTRLLGTFQAVEYVFIVGVGGGVPHYTDYARHVRLGDVVLAAPNKDGQRFIYQYCQAAEVKQSGEVVFETKSWCPPELSLQLIGEQLAMAGSWQDNYMTAVEQLDGDTWARPEQETDKLFMSIGGGDLIEVGHPTPKPGTQDPRADGTPVLHIGPVAAGRGVALDDQLRQEFAYKNGILAYDSELDSVVESIYGNRKDHYMLIRGIADYKDGTRRKEWQHYAALMAASVLKSVVEKIEPVG
eukprot:TRINITY_DN8213_c0_g1_i2.p1 TRINITY_DN8213_c0_g1~~TRINITY_DN8213_c0_g1_i2.p1  ORF type:complete len:565 (+),score=205.78 TRINITY_DN8213_c0_g1_i2:81-1775(+)